jgi:hypothetical protein
MSLLYFLYFFFRMSFFSFLLISFHFFLEHRYINVLGYERWNYDLLTIFFFLLSFLLTLSGHFFGSVESIKYKEDEEKIFLIFSFMIHLVVIKKSQIWLLSILYVVCLWLAFLHVHVNLTKFLKKYIWNKTLFFSLLSHISFNLYTIKI